MTAFQIPGFAVLFVTNVLNGTVAAKGAQVNEGTVVRLVWPSRRAVTPFWSARR